MDAARDEKYSHPEDPSADTKTGLRRASNLEKIFSSFVLFVSFVVKFTFLFCLFWVAA
jgi:hypothetical protein